jgi:hypothetical protein
VSALEIVIAILNFRLSTSLLISQNLGSFNTILTILFVSLRDIDIILENSVVVTFWTMISKIEAKCKLSDAMKMKIWETLN